MIDDFAINDTITKILDFHFGAGFGDDLFNPGENNGLAWHGAWSSGFLDH